MKLYWFALVGISLSTLVACGGGSSIPPPPPPAVHNEWTWMSGANAVYQKGIYGTMGAASPDNTPGARTSPLSWTDASGNLWLFGGYGIDSTGASGDLNDLWKYSGGQWTWMGGSSIIETKGVYGTQGTPAPGDVPGGRYEAARWTDASANFWLFGGLGIDSLGNRGYFNDLWRYSNGEWTWMGGANLASSPGTVACPQGPGVYGAKGVASSDNWPGARVDGMTWTDDSGNLWLFGGGGCDSNGAIGPLNDLWKYSAGGWIWMSGSNTVVPAGANNGIYGTKGIASPNNVPGSRTNAVTWTDAAGSLWLFGGQGSDDATVGKCDVLPETCLLNDLWKYSSGEWTWVGGSNVIGASGVYGTMGTAASGNFPGARWMAVSWIDAEGNVWLFGGQGVDSETSPPIFGELNDLWKYSDGEWTWMSGSNLASATPLGVYGTMGVPSASNVPTQRETAVGWIDHSGNLWLFGGNDDFCCAHGGAFNDLWEYQP